MKPTRRRASMSPPFTAWPNSRAVAFGRRQQPGQHLHRRRLAAAVGAEESEDLAALDPELDMVDGGEGAELLGQAVRLDRRRPARRLRTGAITGSLWPSRASSRQQLDERLLERVRVGLVADLVGRAGVEHLAGVHRHQPVEPLGLVHVGGGDEHAHLSGGARGCGRSGPRTAAARADRRRSSARRGSAGRDRGSASSTGPASASSRPKACPPAGRGTGCRSVLVSRSSIRQSRSALATGRTAGRRSRHSRRSRASGRDSCPGPAADRRSARRPRCGTSASSMSPPSDLGLAALELAHPGEDAEQGRLADPVRPDHPDHLARPGCRG